MQGIREELVQLQGSRLHTAPSLVIPEKSAFLSPRWNSKSNYLILPSCRSPTWRRRAEIGLLHSSCSLLEQFGAEQRGRSAEAGDQSSRRRRGKSQSEAASEQQKYIWKKNQILPAAGTKYFTEISSQDCTLEAFAP